MNHIKKHNFGAGPCILSSPVLAGAADAILNHNDSGLSILEISHRSPEFATILEETKALITELLAVPEGYSILFMQGGASLQFCAIAMNFLKGYKAAAYVNGGYFGEKAIREAKLWGQVIELKPNYARVPADAAYFHYTSNNTIEGTQMHDIPKTGKVPLICDMSSDILTKPIDISKFSLIYAGAQKNMGPAGVTLVIVKDALLDNIQHELPAMLDYRVYRANNSLFNTAPVFAIYAAMLNLRWLKAQGGVSVMEQNSKAKAGLLYQYIDASKRFTALAPVNSRSLINVTFKLEKPEQERDFLDFATERGIVGIKGYHTMGGFRASMYNALPISSVRYLTEVMNDFEVVQKNKSEYV